MRGMPFDYIESAWHAKAKMYTGLMESARGTGAKLQDVVKTLVSLLN